MTTFQTARRLLSSVQPLSKVDREYLDLLSNHRAGNTKNYRKFIVLTTPRSGSSWLLDMINQHPSVYVLGEMFNPEGIYSGRGIGVNTTSKTLLARRDRRPMEFVRERIFRAYASDIASVGFKIFYSHFERDRRGNLIHGLADDRSIAIIHLKRRNLLSIYVSSEIASKNQIWNDRLSTDMIEVDSRKCLAFLRKTANRRAKFEDRFRGHPVLDLCYEEMAENPEAAMTSVWELLNVDPGALPDREPDHVHQKQERRRLSEIIVNYGEIRATLEGTTFARFLEA